eukprot:TRINITY_DN15895_c0_g1_i3.p1 TRINITY_DN15895_c0_g1~~TRINITY_DN15895_c0_g1_i3.p1  ORF type:complete len:214 (+),score=54.26 TRINITY_DN15895_c0_g1_i3:234-875(+)
MGEATAGQAGSEHKTRMEQQFWRNFFDENYFSNYLGPGVGYQDELLDHLPTFDELCKVVPGGAATLDGKSVACLGSAFGHELVELQDHNMKVEGVEFSPYCLQRLLPSAAELTTEADISEWLPNQGDKSFDFVLVSCLEYQASEEALEAVLGHISRICRVGVFVLCVQLDVGEHFDELPVSVLRTHDWWGAKFKQHGFLGLSKDEFVQYASFA